MKTMRTLLLPLVAVSAALSILWFVHRPVPIATSNMDQVQQEAALGGYRLIDIATLAKLYQTDREKILLIDTRQEWEHRAGHIAGSDNFPMEPTWWARWRRKADLAAALGPPGDKAIVFY